MLGNFYEALSGPGPARLGSFGITSMYTYIDQDGKLQTGT